MFTNRSAWTRVRTGVHIIIISSGQSGSTLPLVNTDSSSELISELVQTHRRLRYIHDALREGTLLYRTHRGCFVTSGSLMQHFSADELSALFEFNTL